MNDQWRWTHAPTVIFRESIHGHVVRADLSDFFQRIAYFFGMYHEQDVAAAVRLALRSGDRFLDGGANIGLLTLQGAGCVGPTGTVESFEPFPAVADKLDWHVRENRLTQVRAHRAALGDIEAQLELRLPGFDNLAAATLCETPDRYGSDVRSLGRVPVLRGDSVLDLADTRPLTIKLDVEGYEMLALQGLRNTIEKRFPAIITEINHELLFRAGSSPEHMFDWLAARDYMPFALDLRGWRGLHRLHVHPLTRHQVRYEPNVIWLTPLGVHWERFKPRMTAPARYWRYFTGEYQRERSRLIAEA